MLYQSALTCPRLFGAAAERLPSGSEDSMRKSRFTDDQIFGILRETDQGPVAAVAKKHG